MKWREAVDVLVVSRGAAARVTIVAVCRDPDNKVKGTTDLPGPQTQDLASMTFWIMRCPDPA